MNIYSNPTYAKRYYTFLNTPPVKEGICFGLCVTWLTRCLEEKINNGNVEKYLKMNVSDDFFWEAFSMQRYAHAQLRCPIAKNKLFNRLESNNTTRMQNGSFYRLDYNLFTSDIKILVNNFFDDSIKKSKIGIILPLKIKGAEFEYHAIALLQMGYKRYLLDPNYGVFNITYCLSLSEALIYITHYYLDFKNIKEKKFLSPKIVKDVLCITPTFII